MLEMHPEPHDELRVASFRDLDTTTLYTLLKLRCDVFVVEQKCYYSDLDGRDTEPGTRHVWVARGDEIPAYLRILDDGDVQRIGRVVVAPADRGRGLAQRIIAEALTVVGNRPSVMHAQAHLVEFYGRFGYTPSGPQYLEDGIPHVPLFRAAPQPAR
jgi:ElaA protein